MPTKCRCSRFATAAEVPLPRNGSSRTSPGMVLARRMRCNSASGFCVGMELQPLLIAQSFLTGAEGNEPVAAHLQIFVERFHRGIVEAVATVTLPCRPDQCLMGVGKPPASKIRHRVRFPPNDIVEDPESQVLQDGANTKNIVIAAYDPQGAVLTEQAARLAEPGTGEHVVSLEIDKAVPLLINTIDQAVVRPPQLAAQLQVVWRVCEDAMHGGSRQHAHQFHAVAAQNLIEWEFARDVQGPDTMAERHDAALRLTLANRRMPRQP